jgi:hypothetical protein
MSKYGKVAIKAVEIFKNRELSSPLRAWEIAADEIFKDKEPSIKKGCPRNTFLGLCEEGHVRDIPPGKYTTSKSNKAYAIATIELLRERDIFKEFSEKEIWQKVLTKCNTNLGKKHNDQIPVSKALFENKLLKI